MFVFFINLMRTALNNIINNNSHISIKQNISFSTRFIISQRGKINIKKGLHSKRNVTIHADKGEIKIGENVFINEGCMIVSHKTIVIGNDCSLGPNVMIFDHDHDYKQGKGFISTDVKIGNGVWIGANVIILRGTIIGDNCVIAAGSIIKGLFPANTMVYQRRETYEKRIVKINEN